MGFQHVILCSNTASQRQHANFHSHSRGTNSFDFIVSFIPVEMVYYNLNYPLLRIGLSYISRETVTFYTFLLHTITGFHRAQIPKAISLDYPLLFTEKLQEGISYFISQGLYLLGSDCKKQFYGQLESCGQCFRSVSHEVAVTLLF